MGNKRAADGDGSSRVPQSSRRTATKQKHTASPSKSDPDLSGQLEEARPDGSLTKDVDSGQAARTANSARDGAPSVGEAGSRRSLPLEPVEDTSQSVHHGDHLGYHIFNQPEDIVNIKSSQDFILKVREALDHGYGFVPFIGPGCLRHRERR